jgi:uncharacterized protein
MEGRRSAEAWEGERVEDPWGARQFMVYTEYIRFAWDPRKALSNFAKHGIPFELAITSFDDPFALTAPDERHSTPNERREWVIGESDVGMLVGVFTSRDRDQTRRIISARRASRRERRRYEERKGFSV